MRTIGKYYYNPGELEHKLAIIHPLKSYKWTDIYESESEMLKELSEVDIKIGKCMTNRIAPYYRGYEFIHSFAKQLQEGKTLSQKQITQCKRLASQIKKANIVTKHIKKYNNL